jgi:hypothetical protein
MTVITTEPTTSALLATLRIGTGFPVGDHAPPAPTVAVPRPTSGRYCILQAIPGGALFGSQAFEAEMATLVYQVDSMARSRAQCEWLADRVRQVMLDRTATGWLHPIVVSGAVVAYRNQQTVDSPVDEGRDETGESLWSCRERYEVTVVPG